MTNKEESYEMSKITITNTAHQGYRRGGVSLVQGVNAFAADIFTPVQLAQIQQDPRLLLEGIEPGTNSDQTDHGETTQGHVEQYSLADVVAMIKALDKDDASLWKQDNTPKATAFPRGVSAELRAAAWQSVLDDIENTPADKA
jgi:hypothetical protein